MTEPSRPDQDLEPLFLQYLQELDRGETSGVEEFLSTRNLSAETMRQLRELIGTEKIVQDMAGPPIGEEGEPPPKPCELSSEFEETVQWNRRASEGAAADTTPVATTLGEYEVLEELGRGGMGVVYKARQTEMDREVALKMIRAGCLASEEDIQRFYLEARAAGKLQHPAIVQVFQVGEIDGNHYFTMELIEGDTLSHYVQREGLSPMQIAEMMLKLVEAIDFAHQHGLLHRDLKPSNVLVDRHGNPHVTDFGLAKDLNSGDELTSSGSAVGTPSYMPPEQARAQRDEITYRSDVYSLGAILYALLTGHPPFKADSLVETLTKVIYEDPVAPRDIDPSCPRGLEAICLKCLQKSPADRYQTAAELAEDLQRFIRGERVGARESHWYDRVWQWLRNVPVIAAVLGRKSASSTPAHVRFQWGVIALAASLIVGLMLMPWAIEAHRFSVVDISTGQAGLTYQQIGDVLAESLRSKLGWKVEPHPSAGAIMNREQLQSGEADVAFLQANTLESEDLKVLAPLYPEAVLVILRKEVTAQNIQGLKDLHIALGDQQSGMRYSSATLLSHFGLSAQSLSLKDTDHSFVDLATDPDLEGAIVTIKLDDHRLRKLLETGEYRLLEMPTKGGISGLTPMHLDPGDFPGGVVPAEGMLVLNTFAILAVRKSTPDRYVTEILEALYADGGVADKFSDVMSKEDASFEKQLNYHDAARRYFNQIRHQTKASQAP